MRQLLVPDPRQAGVASAGHGCAHGPGVHTEPSPDGVILGSSAFFKSGRGEFDYLARRKSWLDTPKTERAQSSAVEHIFVKYHMDREDTGI
jgi:hypothetical protein